MPNRAGTTPLHRRESNIMEQPSPANRENRELKCSNCGTHNPPQTNFCGNCGRPLRGIDSGSPLEPVRKFSNIVAISVVVGLVSYPLCCAATMLPTGLDSSTASQDASLFAFLFAATGIPSIVIGAITYLILINRTTSQRRAK